MNISPAHLHSKVSNENVDGIGTLNCYVIFTIHHSIMYLCFIMVSTYPTCKPQSRFISMHGYTKSSQIQLYLWQPTEEVIEINSFCRRTDHINVKPKIKASEIHPKMGA